MVDLVCRVYSDESSFTPVLKSLNFKESQHGPPDAVVILVRSLPLVAVLQA
jgi:hypothetical protein